MFDLRAYSLTFRYNSTSTGNSSGSLSGPRFEQMQRLEGSQHARQRSFGSASERSIA